MVVPSAQIQPRLAGPPGRSEAEHFDDTALAKTWQLLGPVHTRNGVPLDTRVRVFRSPIHGYGVLALRDFQPGEILAEVEGILYRAHELGDDRYCLWVDGDFYFDMVDQTRWINHSCDPNSEIEADLDGQGGAWARVIALRPIRAGEEITYDYAFSQEHAEPCSCGVARCAGWIVDTDELPQLVERLAREQARAGRAGSEPAPQMAPIRRT